MKILMILTVIAVATGVYVSRGLETVTNSVSKPTVAEGSVAHYCTKAIPHIWKAAKESGDDFDEVPEKLVFTAFDLVATNYCICNQDKFGEGRRAREKALFGLLAGLNLKLEFSSGLGKEQRETLKLEGQAIAKKYGGLIKAQPSWLKETNNYFRSCKKEQEIRGNLMSKFLR